MPDTEVISSSFFVQSNEKERTAMMSERWNIMPYVGVGPLKFGLSRAVARSLVEGTPSTFRQNQYAESDTDAYEELHLYYDSKDTLKCIMGYGSSPIHYDNVILMDRSLRDVLDELTTLGLRARYDDEGHWVDDAGFVIYAQDNTVKAITVYRKGYYEEQVALASQHAKNGEDKGGAEKGTEQI
jgi:hypothetical protein